MRAAGGRQDDQGDLCPSTSPVKTGTGPAPRQPSPLLAVTSSYRWSLGCLSCSGLRTRSPTEWKSPGTVRIHSLQQPCRLQEPQSVPPASPVVVAVQIQALHTTGQPPPVFLSGPCLPFSKFQRHLCWVNQTCSLLALDSAGTLQRTQMGGRVADAQVRGPQVTLTITFFITQVELPESKEGDLVSQPCTD